MRHSPPRFLTHPATPLLAGAVFLFTVWLLPISDPSPSAAGEFINGLLGFGKSRVSFVPLDYMGYERKDDAMVALGRAESWNPNSTPPCIASLYRPVVWRGLWAPTTCNTGLRIRTDCLSGSVADIQQARSLFLDHIAASHADLGPFVPALRSGDWSETTTSWSGYLHNTASLASFFLFATSMSLITRGAWRRLRTPPGQCPHCRYDLRATPPTSPCPECGHTRPARVQPS